MSILSSDYISGYETLIQKYAGLIADRKGMYIKDSLLPSSRHKIKEAFFNMTEYTLKQKDVDLKTVQGFSVLYSFLPYFINDNLTEKHNPVWEELRDNREQFQKDNPDVTEEFKKLIVEVNRESLTLHEEILNYIGTFEQGKGYKEAMGISEDYELSMMVYKGKNMRCLKCGLENPPNTSKCNCGYDFISASYCLF